MAGKDFEDSISIESFFNEILGLITQDIVKEIHEKLMENIQKNTYDYGGANKSYFDGSGNPTGQFKESFKIESLKKDLTGWTQEIVYDYMSMELLQPSGGGLPAHGSYGAGGTLIDQRQALASILDRNGTTAGKQRQEFWQPTINWINDNLDSMIRKYAKIYGLELV